MDCIMLVTYAQRSQKSNAVLRILEEDDDMGRTFQYLNREWNVELTGMSHAVASGFSPNTASWGVCFKPVDDPSAGPVYGSIWRPDLAQLSEDDVRRVLESALLVRKALEDPDKTAS